MENKDLLLQLIEEFYPYAKEQLGFQDECRITLSKDANNAADPLGKTAYYDPAEKKITLFIHGRHPKDVLRSLSHELVHHKQNGEGVLDGAPAGEGYAQKDPHLRKMEEEAFLKGNMIFRDWEDGRKQMKESKKKDWQRDSYDKRGERLFNRLVKSYVTERIKFDTPSNHLEEPEQIDPDLLQDIQDMIAAKESDEDILHQLVRAEGIEMSQAEEYIRTARSVQCHLQIK